MDQYGLNPDTGQGHPRGTRWGQWGDQQCAEVQSGSSARGGAQREILLILTGAEISPIHCFAPCAEQNGLEW